MTLRKALYYSNANPDAQKALKYYKQALAQCQEFNLDPFSDEVTGIKIQLAAWFEKIGSFDNAIKVLEALLDDFTRWVDDMDADRAARPSAVNGSVDRPQQDKDRPLENESGASPSETPWARRNRLLAKSVGISTKLGELYSNEHVLRIDRAHERLIWAVETALAELRRRSVDGVKEGEGQWLDSEAIGGALEGEPFQGPSLTPCPFFRIG
jgi:hypothetical protein